MNSSTLPPLDLQRFQAFLYKKGHGGRRKAITPQQTVEARQQRTEGRRRLRWPNCTAEIRGYSIDSKGQRYAVYSNGRLEKVPAVSE